MGSALSITMADAIGVWLAVYIKALHDAISALSELRAKDCEGSAALDTWSIMVFSDMSLCVVTREEYDYGRKGHSRVVV